MHRISHAGGVAAHLLLVVVILRFDPLALCAPRPLLCVLLGTLLLTAFQLRHGQSWSERLDNARWNAFLAGLLTTLIEFLALFSSPDARSGATLLPALTKALIPLLYGSILSLALDVRTGDKIGTDNAEDASDPSGHPDASMADDQPTGTEGSEGRNPADTSDPTDLAIPSVIRLDTETAHRILTAQGFTVRECHVAIRLIADTSNREIAESLYITETTVKKHIQNLFRKCGATNRKTFRHLFVEWMRTEAAQHSPKQVSG